MNLSELPRGLEARIDSVLAQGENDVIARRLRDLGFVRGETVRVVAVGPFGGDPIAVQVSGARFALRRKEAARVQLESRP